jgi:hypothetical protein
MWNLGGKWFDVKCQLFVQDKQCIQPKMNDEYLCEEAHIPPGKLDWPVGEGGLRVKL